MCHDMTCTTQPNIFCRTSTPPYGNCTPWLRCPTTPKNCKGTAQGTQQRAPGFSLAWSKSNWASVGLAGTNPWRPNFVTNRTQRIPRRRNGIRHHRAPSEVLCPCLDGSGPSAIHGGLDLFREVRWIFDRIGIFGVWSQEGHPLSSFSGPLCHSQAVFRCLRVHCPACGGHRHLGVLCLLQGFGKWCVSSYTHMNTRTKGFPAGHCTIARWAIFSVLHLLVYFNVVTDQCESQLKLAYDAS